MERAQAESGRAGPAGLFWLPALAERGVCEDGDSQIGRDGDAGVIESNAPHHAEAPAPAMNRQVLDPTVLTNVVGAFEETLGRPKGLDWEAHGHLGQMTGRLTGPVQFIRKLMEFWRLGMPEAVGMLGYDPEDFELVTAVLHGKEQFCGRDVRDRIAHLFCIRRTLWSLFRDLDVENDWLREQHHMLNEKSPLSLMLEGSMEDLLLAREYVDSAAGFR